MNCPHCNTELRPVYFNGYYESFSAWVCACVEIPNATEVVGAYIYPSGDFDAPHMDEFKEKL